MPHYDELPRVPAQQVRTGLDAASVRQDFLEHLRFSQAKHPRNATPHDRYTALALAARDRVIERWQETAARYHESDARRVYYLSAEFLMGRALRNNLLNTGLWDAAVEAARTLGIDLAQLLEDEPEPGLGNGGLGRLAACLLESMATLGLPGHGYGIRYEFGIFEQVIRDGFQVERADEWLRFGNPWEIERPEYTVTVRLGGHTEVVPDGRGGFRVFWTGGEEVIGVPYDTPVAGYRTNTVNSLRLWAARAGEEFDFSLFNSGDYVSAVQAKNASEVISKVLYPNDNFEAGRELRLRQEYFFVACSIHDIVRRHSKTHPDLSTFSDKVAIQLNDTHPAIAIAELMRVFVDEHSMAWVEAWKQTTKTFAYTNHTLLPEALEKWPVGLFERLLPRHLEIIQEINRRFMREVTIAYPRDDVRAARMSIIDDASEPNVHMAKLAVVGSHSVNGVAALHTELIKSQLLRDFAELYPSRFTNKTNGVTPRRWILGCNPELSTLITETLGSSAWVTDLSRIADLEPHVESGAFRERVRAVKRKNKLALASLIQDELDVAVDPASIFDCQIKRLHEYKRQLLNALHIVALYLRAKRGENVAPRTFIFGAKAAPGYKTAKLVIKFIHAVASVVNADRAASPLRVAFLPNYRVSLAERIIPAADLSEQISTAGMEASGTGNMKFAMNGALTIGTLDGANIEIREAVGAENFFLFGLTAEEVLEHKRARIAGRRAYETNELLAQAIDLIESGFFCPEDKELFRPLLDELLGRDEYLVMADFAAYATCQEEVGAAFMDVDDWSRRAALNIARMGWFSSDRTVAEYAREIWSIRHVDVALRENDR